MSSMLDKVNYIEGIKNNIAKAITDKGGTVTNDFDSYAPAITNLPSGGASYDFSVLGYDTPPDTDLQKYIDYSEQIKNNWGPNTTNGFNKYAGDSMMKFFPVVDFTKLGDAFLMFANTPLEYFPKLSSPSLTRTYNMFENCVSLKEFGGLDTSKVTDFSGMFRECSSLHSSITFDVNSATEVDNMFRNCKNLTEVNFTGDTSKIKDWSNAFGGCKNLTKIPVIDITAVDKSHKYNNTNITDGCSNLHLIEFKSNDTYSGNFFSGRNYIFGTGLPPTGKVILHGSTDIWADYTATYVKDQLPKDWTVEFDRSYVYK